MKEVVIEKLHGGVIACNKKMVIVVHEVIKKGLDPVEAIEKRDISGNESDGQQLRNGLLFLHACIT